MVEDISDPRTVPKAFELGLAGEWIILCQRRIFFPNDSLRKTAWVENLPWLHTNQIIWMKIIHINKAFYLERTWRFSKTLASIISDSVAAV